CVMARPSSPGIMRSVINTVGFRRVTMSTASSPLDASPATRMFGSDSSKARSPCLTTTWSSASTTLTMTLPSQSLGHTSSDDWRSGSGVVILTETTIPHQREERLHKHGGPDSAGRQRERRVVGQFGFSYAPARQFQNGSIISRTQLKYAQF